MGTTSGEDNSAIFIFAFFLTGVNSSRTENAPVGY